MRERMIDVKCQDSMCLSGGKTDCPTCGNRGIVLKKAQCKSCLTDCWIDPKKSYPNIAGQKYKSFDGLQFLVLGANRTVCEKCRDWEKYL